MRRRSVLDRAERGVRVNVVPMIDVVMCLIVFYLMVGQLAMNRSAGIELPPTAEGAAPVQGVGDPIVLGVRADGTVLLDGEPTGPDRLRGELAGRLARAPEARVEIRADEETDYAAVRPVVEAARAAGVSAVELVTERGG